MSQISLFDLIDREVQENTEGAVRDMAETLVEESSAVSHCETQEFPLQVYEFKQGDRKYNNETVLRMIDDGAVNREKAIRYYTGWGGLIKASQDQIQELGFTASNILAGGQYLTPLWVSEMIVSMLPELEGEWRIFDPTCGSGCLFWHFPSNWKKFGIEIEETAYKVARAVYPEAQIIQDDVLYHVEDVEGQMDVVVTNPPFGLYWQVDGDTILEVSGYGGKVVSHLATMEIGIRSLRKGGIMFAILPQGVLEREELINFRRWVRNYCTEVGIIDLPKETFRPNGTEAKTFIWILMKCFAWRAERENIFTYNIVWKDEQCWNPGVECVESFKSSFWYEFIRERFLSLTPVSRTEVELKKYDPNPEIVIEKWNTVLPEMDVDVVELKLGKYDVIMKPKGLVAALKVEELKEVVLGPEWNYSTQEYEYQYRKYTSLQRYYTGTEDLLNGKLIWYLKAMGLRVEVDSALLNWIEKKRKWYQRMQTPYEIFDLDPYGHIDEDDVFGTVRAGDYVRAMFNVYRSRWSLRYSEGKNYQVLRVDGEGDDRVVVMACEYDDEKFEFRRQEMTYFEYESWGGEIATQSFSFNTLFVKLDMGYKEDQAGVMTRYEAEYKKWLKKLDELSQFRYLFPYQKQDVARLALKPFNYLGYLQGLGKTDTTYALGMVMGMKKVLVVCLSSLVDTWVEIGKRIGIKYKVITEPDDVRGLKATDETVFYIVSYERLTSYNTSYKPGKCGKCDGEFIGKVCPICGWKAGKKWLSDHSTKSKPLYKYMKRITWSMIAVDESQCIKAKNSLRANAVRALKTRRKLLITGTIIKGWISDSFWQLHWAFAGGSPLFPYNGWKGGTREYLRTFATYEFVSSQWADTVTSGRKKMVPEVKNVEIFWNMMQPKMIRRRAEHPGVLQYINLPEVKQYKIWVDMEPEQKEFYQWWLENFSQWFNSRLEEEERNDGRKLTGMEILSMLWKLRFAATVPNSEKVNNEMVQYQGNGTIKANQVEEIIRECIKRKEKVIVYTGLNDMADELVNRLRKYGVEKVIGSVSIQKRNKIRKKFIETNELNVLVAGIMAMGRGVTLTSANNVIFTDLDWTPDSIEQAWKRVHRISQTKDVNVYFVLSKDTIDEDIDQLVYDKQVAIAKAIDRTEYQDKTESFSPREFAMKMLERRGMLINRYLGGEIADSECKLPSSNAQIANVSNAKRGL